VRRGTPKGATRMSPGSTEDGKAKLSKIRRAILHPKRLGGACLLKKE
jgi:hypothetical protein